MAGACLAAVDVGATPALKTVFAGIAASEAQHLSTFSMLQRDRPIGISFPNLGEEATAFLDGYLA